MSGRQSGRAEETGSARSRGQSHVVGAVLLLGLTVIALASLTAAVGAIVEDQTARADATRVASEFEDTIRPLETTGHREGSVSFAEGSLDVRERTLRVRNESATVATVPVDALVFEHGDRRVASVTGAVVQGRPGSAWLERDPPITVGPDALVVGATRLNGSGGVGGTGGATVPLRTNVSHERADLGRDTYSVAIETATPGAFERYADDIGANATVRDFDGDGLPSVVLSLDGQRRGYLVVHDMRLEVGHG